VFKAFIPRLELTKRKIEKFFRRSFYILIHKPLIILTKINRYYGVSKILTFNNKTSNIYPDLIRELKIVVKSIALQSNM
jgi:hypothetical protein